MNDFIKKPVYFSRSIDPLSEEGVFSLISSLDTVVYLDSSYSESESLSLIGWNPYLEIFEKSGQPYLLKNGLEKALISHYKVALEEIMDCCESDSEEFCGALMGYHAYDAWLLSMSSRHKIKRRKAVSSIPLYWFALFQDYIEINHKTGEWRHIQLSFDGSKPNGILTFTEALMSRFPFQVVGAPKPELTKVDYIQKIDSIKHYIYEGECYQVNFTYAYEGQFKGDMLEYYRHLREISPAPFSSFIKNRYGEISSSSPEEFLYIDKSYIRTRPIKGTLSSDCDSSYLINSAKNNAELTMIVDLERHDLGQLCEYGSIQASKSPDLVSFAQVHHLIGTVSGNLKPEITHAMALTSLSPGGSITGAPKVRSMEIIEELEGRSRSLYTGSLGYFGFNQKSHFNIAIRTLYSVGSNFYFHVGGGIVADSEPENEWEETLSKAKGILDALTSFTPAILSK